MLITGTTVPGWEKEGFIKTFDVPTNSPPPSKFFRDEKVMNSIAGAMALVSLGLSPVVIEAPTNRVIELSRYSQNVRSNNQIKFANYKVDDEQSVYSYLNKHPDAIIFFEKIDPIIKAFFDEVLIELTSWTSPVDEETHLYMTIHSGIQNEETLMDKEIALFDKIEGDSLLREGLAHVILAIR